MRVVCRRRFTLTNLLIEPELSHHSWLSSWGREVRALFAIRKQPRVTIVFVLSAVTDFLAPASSQQT